ncbi:MAG: type VII secretion protein EssC [Lachnospiraceae bacterium]|nr:type VII secretion protein EssC [Lachnospiraceae bacterium]
MSIILSAYVQNAFCEFLLPAVNNTDTQIVLKKNIFAFSEDVILELEVVEKEWFIKDTDNYYCTKQQGETGSPLKNGDIVTVHEAHGNEISIIVRETECSFSVFRKYDLSNIQGLSIGNEQGNHIIYQYLSLVSRRHAVLQRTAQGFCIQDTSANGTFVNGKRVNGAAELAIGDCINIFGLKIVYLGNLIAVYAPEENPCTVYEGVPVYVQRNGVTAASSGKNMLSKAKKFFHRAPRNYVKLETESIEIEAPPNPKEESKKPLWMVIGPSFTMMIPMLTGSIIAIMNARSNGGGSSSYMYTGIITAVGSALIGVFWALTNIRYNKKEIRKGEQKRFQAYGEYLIKRAEFIREKYEKSRSTLLTMYPPASVSVTYGENSTELWNRNRKHEDFMFQRLGTGSLPFQMAINVPKEKFTLISDELSEKPRVIKEEYSVLYDVPVNVDLLTHKLIGVVGGEKKLGAFEIVRLLTAQIAANNCYTDVKLVYIYDKNKDDENWEYTHWLPHVWSEDKKTRFVASNKSEASDVLFELTQVLRMRAEDEQQRKITLPKPYYVLVVSDMELLEGELITKYMYECDPCYGMTTLILSESREQLPNECEYLLQNDNEFKGIYNLTKERNQAIQFDSVSCEQVEAFARRLLPIEVKEVEKGRDIPNSLTFFDMHNVSALNELDVEEKWRKNRTYENMRALIGAKAGGAPCYLDVHEKYHGPHGLVAGTTGSGKSETLQTYMLSLAINFSPDDIGYFIIDYKGGGMAGLFDGLPHMIGSISNLSGSQVRRAMVSIKSENRRRQRIFSENNVNNINLYTKLYKNGEASIPVPHMFIIIDEFAELKREEPEFMKELISVAQVGRSLGVHLILATQKPSGTVDDNIWSNAKFRLCLRVQDRQDSNDMLHKPDAAYITQAGRGYLQVGNDEVYELFQSGYSGATYDENGANIKTEIASMLSLPGKAALIGNSLKSKQQEQIRNKWVQKLLAVLDEAATAQEEDIPAFAEDMNRITIFFDLADKNKLEYPYTEYNGRRVEDLIQMYASVYDSVKEATPEEAARAVITVADRLHKKLPETKSKTQLDAVIEYLGVVAQKEGYTHQMQLWMPLLPEVMFLKELQGYANNIYDGNAWPQIQGKWNLSVPVGLCDDPVNQAQMPLVIDFSEGGHLAVCGTIISGKSSFLQTMLFGLINRYQPDWLNIYAIDFSSRMLASLEKAPHTGGIMYEDDTEKIDKFFHMIEGVMEERKKLFCGGNYAQYVQVNGVKVPAIIVAIDNLGAFREKTENKYDDRILRLAKEGVGYGIYLAVTAAGFSSAEITSKMGDNIKTVVCLQMNDKFGYADALRNNHIEALPESNIKGRGLAIVGESVLEFQTALALEADDDFKRIEEIQNVCVQMSSVWTGRRAKTIPVIPEKPVWNEYELLDDVKEMQAGNRYLPIGYDMSSADVYGIDLSKTYSYLVSGKARTGKTNLLKAIIRSAAKKEANVVVIEHGAADLKSVAQAAGAEYISNQKEQADFFAGLVEPFKQRNLKKRTLIEEGKEEFEIFEAMQSEKPYFIVVSDIVSFVQSVTKPEEGIMNIKGFVENVAEKGKLHNVYFISAINPDTVSPVLGMKIYESLVGFHTGVHLGGAVNNIRYFDFSNLSYMEQSKVQKPGIGLLPTANEEEISRVVIPLVRG